MLGLKLGALQDDRPVKLTLELPAQVHRDLLTYAEEISRAGTTPVEPARLIAPMIERFMATDRAFRKVLRLRRERDGAPSSKGA